MSSEAASEWMSPQEAAAYLKIGMDTFYRAVAGTHGAVALRHIRINGNRNIRTKRTWCDAWMEQFEEKTPGDPQPPARPHAVVG